MKKLIYLLPFVVLHACTVNQISHNEPPSLSKPFKVFFQENQYAIQSKSDLEAFSRAATGLADLQILETGIEKMEDELGVFYAIRTKYRADGQQAVIVVPLDVRNKTNKAGNMAIYYAECAMTCTAPADNAGYNHLIYERCKKQSCACEEGTEGCAVAVIF